MAKKTFRYDASLSYTMQVLWSFIRKQKIYFWGVLIFTLLIELVVFADKFIYKYLVDRATDFSKNLIAPQLFAKMIFWLALSYLALKVFQSLFWFYRVHNLNLLDGNVMADVEKKSFWHIINLSYLFHLNKKTGSIISQFTRGVSKTESLIDAFAFHFFPTIFRLILSVGIISIFNGKVALILGVTSFSFITFGVYWSHKQRYAQQVANAKEDTLKQNLSDVFLNIETVKYFGKEQPTYAYFRNLANKLKESRFIFWRFHSWHSGIQTMIIGIGMSAMLYVMFNGFLDGELTLGSLTLILSSIWTLIPNLFGLIHGYRDFIRSSVDVSALFEMFKEKNEVVDIDDARKIKIDKGKIEFNNVNFTYPKNKSEKQIQIALKNFNLKIASDTKLALVGPSGSGKTTVIKLLYRLFDIDDGEILIDGQNINSVTQESLRNSMSIVPQEPILFDNSIFFNIAYANPKASSKNVWKAIKFAQLDKFISKLPHKEKTIVGERGVKLSGGEKQRVSIARAILANKKILVLDEATSALDSETEKEIQRDLEHLMKNRTTIIIAHRLSTIMKADKIVVLSKGEIIEVGNHKELKNKQGGLYKRLWSLQQGGSL
jgi:ATP-binding cassette, subfamily B, heavy metal transporter